MKLKKIVTFLIIVLVGIQFVPTKFNQSNQLLKSDFSIIFNVPNHIDNILKKSCNDCHSNNTNYPWYNRIQPLSWLLENHIEKGKKELNLSEFGRYSMRKQRSKLKAIISQIKDGEMPISSYTLIHRDAKLSDKDKDLLIKWTQKLRDSL